MGRDPKLELAERFLDHLINPEDCVDIFGRTYIDDLEHIVAENHGYDFSTRSFRSFADLVFLDETTDAWFQRVRAGLQIGSMEEFIAYVRTNQNELDLANARPRIRSLELYRDDPLFHQLEAGDDSIENVNEFQRKWSADQHKSSPELETDPHFYEHYLSYDRVNPWTYLIRRELKQGRIGAEEKIVCIGNRWSAEVRYFRDIIGLKNTIGVDLFSADTEFVLAADMHRMPFEDGSVKLVFARGVANKSYDFRLFLKEVRRILKPDGFVIIEQPIYTHGVDVLQASDFKNSANLLRLLRWQLRRIVYTDGTQGHCHRFTYDNVRVARIFVQLGPNPGGELPPPDPFPHFRFYFYSLWRNWVMEWRTGALSRHPKADSATLIVIGANLTLGIVGAAWQIPILAKRSWQVLRQEGWAGFQVRAERWLRKRAARHDA